MKKKQINILLVFIIFISILMRLYAGFYGYGRTDEFEAYKWGVELRYYSHARFISFLPGPYQNLIAYGLISLFKTIRAFFYFWAFLGALTTYLIYWLTNKIYCANAKYIFFNNPNSLFRQSYSEMYAFFPALFFALMPWPVKLSSFFWNPNFIIPLSTLFLGYFWDVLWMPRSKNILGMIVVFSVMPFFHMIAVFSIPAIVIIFLIRKIHYEKKYLLPFSFNIKFLLIGFLISVALWVPFIYFDMKNSFFIIKGYFNYSEQFRFHPESLKFISDSLIVTTNEMSRFTGNSSNEYFRFLEQSFGSLYLGIFLVLLSITVSLFSFIRFFRNVSFSIQRVYSALFLALSIFFYFITFKPHELRYTVIYYPILIFIVTEPIYLSIIDKNWLNVPLIKKMPQIKWRRIFFAILLFIVLTGVYLSIQLSYQKGHPNIDNQVVYADTLTSYEQLKIILVKDYLKSIGKSLSDKALFKIIHYYPSSYILSKADYSMRHSIFYFFGLKQNNFHMQNELDTLLYELNNPKFHYYLGNAFIYGSQRKDRLNEIYNLTVQFTNSNTALIANTAGKNDAIIEFVDKIFYSENKNKLSNYIIIGEISNAYILKKIENGKLYTAIAVK